jgi:hypothetical protein
MGQTIIPENLVSDEKKMTPCKNVKTSTQKDNSGGNLQ